LLHCGRAQLRIASDARDILHDIEAPETGSQHPVASHPQAMLVEREPELNRIEVVGEHYLGVEGLQCRRKPPEIAWIGAGHDVYVLRTADDAMGRERKAANDHELDAVLGQDRQERLDLQRRRAGSHDDSPVPEAIPVSVRLRADV
jgi:hypothetical protein